MLRRCALAGAAVGTWLLTALVMLPAQADGVSCPSGQEYDQRTGVCTIVVSDSGDDRNQVVPEPAAPVADRGGRGSRGESPCRMRNVNTGKSDPVPCRSREGYWSNARDCYIRPMKPPPAKSSPLWDGHEDGGVYECVRVQGQVSVSIRFWSKNAPAAPGAPPDPAEVARTIVRQMQLRAITIGMAPEDARDSLGIVGVPAWMWVSGPDGPTFGPLTRSASVGGTSVTATAKVDRIVWEMGDGTSVTCTTAGTPFADGDGGDESPDCGHTYSRQGRYTVRARSFWSVEWTSNSGASGTIPIDFTSTRSLRVGEIQVVRS